MGSIKGLQGNQVLGSAAKNAGGFYDPNAMSNIGDFGDSIGINTGLNGNPMGLPGAAPEQANIQQGTSVADVNNAQAGTSHALDKQNALLSALQGQNGLAQQNAIAGQQGALYNQLNQANGVGTQQSAISGLQNTAGMYNNIANGVGPNPAMAALNNQTGQNVANQAALMAGQRGAGSNVGLMARQAGMQGANTQQQSVGQGANLMANQQLGALAGMGNTQQAIGGLGTNQLAAQQAQQGAMAGQANTVAGQQIAGTTANTQAQMANQGQMQNALAGINQANVASQGNVNAANAQLGSVNAKGKQDLMGGIMNGIGSLGGSAMGAQGGEVVKMAGGGVPEQSPMMAQPMAPQGPQSSFGQFLNGWEDEKKNPEENLYKTDYNMGSGAKKEGKSATESLAPLITMAMMASKGGMAKSGGPVKAKAPDQKAVKRGNSYDNDKIPAMLSEGEIVIPRNILQSKDPVGGAADFVAKIMAKRGKK